ncbi:MAG TPA: CDP-alcohol phosphatidyltransferase family protein [Anaerolineales bacterium]|nr:CDP-alcohol phosphatidyltransferase family protein [Anaerolineales bacterium]
MQKTETPSVQELKRFKHAKGDPRAFWFDGLSTPIVRLLFKTPITPLQVNFSASVVGLLMGLAFIPGTLWGRFLGFGLFFLYIILDAVDGQLARARVDITLKGAYLDKMGHYVVYPVAGMAIGYGSFVTTGSPVMLWMGFLLGLSQTISSASRDSFRAIYKDRAESAPEKIEYERAGPVKRLALRLLRFETLLYLVVFSALADRLFATNWEAIVIGGYAIGLLFLNLFKTYLFYSNEQLYSR